jgi:alkylresorcinol/alkylpyrone synthase
MRHMSEIRAVRGALPEHVHAQDEVTAMLADLVLPGEAEDSPRRSLMRRLHGATSVRTRHLALPLGEYAALTDFGAANDAFIRVGLDLGERAVARALAAAGVPAEDVDLLVTTSVTGVAAPSLDARLAGPLGLRDDVKRLPLFGLGCVAGVAGIARLHDYLAGHPDGVAVLLSIELCSLTFQRDDASTAAMVGSGLFGDGAAAVVMVGAERAARTASRVPAGPRVLAGRSRLYPDSQRVMGWDVSGSGFTLVLSPGVAGVVDTYLGDDVKRFLGDHGLAIEDVDTWVAHPGGPKVIEAITRALSLPPEALDVTRRSLAALGNLSSSSVLHVLADTIAQRPPDPADRRPGLMLAMGPGFCSELVLLDW